MGFIRLDFDPAPAAPRGRPPGRLCTNGIGATHPMPSDDPRLAKARHAVQRDRTLPAGHGVHRPDFDPAPRNPTARVRPHGERPLRNRDRSDLPHAKRRFSPWRKHATPSSETAPCPLDMGFIGWISIRRRATQPHEGAHMGSGPYANLDRSDLPHAKRRSSLGESTPRVQRDRIRPRWTWGRSALFRFCPLTPPGGGAGRGRAGQWRGRARARPRRGSGAGPAPARCRGRPCSAPA
jgi:hypothetical protein